ncbi:hypothetical protein CRENBAI_019970 [Crenichthys baileyi]|uniref:Uncharacterized protein n=1 Tax=Crenichthys baileyi TaxID=28760 RepID=A0AAV9QUP9_9TELE
MTSKRNGRVDEESTNRRAARRKEAASTSKRQEPKPVLSEGGKSRIWRHLVGLLRETDERSTVSPENPNEAQLPNPKSTFYTRNFWESSRIKANQWNFEEL